MNGSGNRDRLVNFFPRVKTEDDWGTEGEGDGTAIPAFAKVFYGRGSERREAAQAGSDQRATFNVLSSVQLRSADETWEIDYDGSRWAINAIVPIGQNRELDFTATRKGA